MYTPRSHRARSIAASTSKISSTSTFPSSTSKKATHNRPPIGGNLGGPTNVGSTGLGVTQTTILPPLQTSAANSPTTVTIIVPAATSQPLGGSGDIPPGFGGDGDGDSKAITIIGGNPTFPGSSTFLTRTAPTSVSVPAATDDGLVTQPVKAKAGAPTISTEDPAEPTQTPAAGEFSTTTISNPDAPTQTDSAVIQDAKQAHHGLSLGGIAGIILITIFLLVIVFVFLRRRKRAAQSPHTEVPEIREIPTPPPPHSEYEESALAFMAPHSPLDSTYSSTIASRRSPSHHVDSDSDISQLTLPPPPMVEIDGRSRPVPMLVLDNSRYRRNPHDSRLSVITSVSGESRQASPASPKIYSSSEAYGLRAPPSPFHGSDSSGPSSATSLKVPPSPRTPTRGSGFIPPIPPLPRSPPPIPGVHANPFVDRNPFDDPAG